MFEVFAAAAESAELAAAAESGESAVRPGADPVAAAEFAECSGAILAKLVADAMSSLPEIPDTMAGDAQLHDLITATTRIDAWSEAIRCRVTSLLYARTLAEHRRFGLVSGRDDPGSWGTAAGASHGFDDAAFTRAELAGNLSLELGRSLPAAAADVSMALGLVRTPDAHTALATGRMDPAQARALIGELDHLPDPELRHEVAASLVTDPQLPQADAVLVRELRGDRKRLWDLTPAQLKAIVRREAAEREPELVAARARAERDDRHLRYHARRDGMADLVLRGPAEMLSAAHRRIDDAARAARRAGARETIDQLRHDIAVDWLIGGGASEGAAAGALICVTVHDTTLLGLDDEPAILHGPAGPQPLPAELARRLAYDPEQATWRRILLDGSSGVAIDISRNYRPPPRMAEFVKVRDGHQSRFPTSGAGRVELDHVQPFDRLDPDRGGATTSSNLSSAGQLDHHLKTDGGLTVTGDANKALTFRTTAGREFSSHPAQYIDPRRAGASDEDGHPRARPPEHGPADGSNEIGADGSAGRDEGRGPPGRDDAPF